MLAAVTVDADVCLPRVGLRGAHAQADLAPYAAALDAGRADPYTVHRAFGLAVKLVLVGKAAVPVPLLVRRSVPGAYPQHTAGHAVQAVVVAARCKVYAITFSIEILPIYIEALSAFVVDDLANAHPSRLV